MAGKEKNCQWYFADQPNGHEIVQKTIGQNITEYLLRYRVEQAKIALENPDSTISWIACCCGFYDASHFIRVFKQFTGMTPGEYRKSKKS